MTTFETASITLAIIAMVISTYSIMSAFAAKRSAEAAEQQADAATRQAQAAEDQIILMRRTMSAEVIARYQKVRRMVTEMDAGIDAVHRAAQRGQFPNQWAGDLQKHRSNRQAAEDAIPTLPAVARQALAVYVAACTAGDQQIAGGWLDRVARADIDVARGRALAALDVLIAGEIAAAEG